MDCVFVRAHLQANRKYPIRPGPQANSLLYRSSSFRIRSLPVLQDFMYSMTGTGLLQAILPIDGGINPLASMKYARIVLFGEMAFESTTGMSGFLIRQSNLLCHRLSQSLRNRWYVSRVTRYIAWQVVLWANTA